MEVTGWGLLTGVTWVGVTGGGNLEVTGWRLLGVVTGRVLLGGFWAVFRGYFWVFWEILDWRQNT